MFNLDEMDDDEIENIIINNFGEVPVFEEDEEDDDQNVFQGIEGHRGDAPPPGGRVGENYNAMPPLNQIDAEEEANFADVENNYDSDVSNEGQISSPRAHKGAKHDGDKNADDAGDKVGASADKNALGRDKSQGAAQGHAIASTSSGVHRSGVVSLPAVVGAPKAMSVDDCTATTSTSTSNDTNYALAGYRNSTASALEKTSPTGAAVVNANVSVSPSPRRHQRPSLLSPNQTSSPPPSTPIPAATSKAPAAIAKQPPLAPCTTTAAVAIPSDTDTSYSSEHDSQDETLSRDHSLYDEIRQSYCNAGRRGSWLVYWAYKSLTTMHRLYPPPNEEGYIMCNIYIYIYIYI